MPRSTRIPIPLARPGRAALLLVAAGALAAAGTGCAPKRVVNGRAVGAAPGSPPASSAAPASAPAPARTAPRPNPPDGPAELPRPEIRTAAADTGAVRIDLPSPLPRGLSGAVAPERFPESVRLGAEAAALAREQVGKPYQWGASGPDAFDCSGLVQHVFGQLGIDLPRVSSDQAAVGRPVRRSELQAGDLLFFSIDGGDIDHVGIYVGDSEFIHAPRRYVPVSVESLHSAWWLRHFREARRLR